MAYRDFHRYNLLSLNNLQDRPGFPERLDTAQRMVQAVSRAEWDILNADARFRFHRWAHWPPGHGDDRFAQDRDQRSENLVRYGIRVRTNIHISTNDPWKPFLMINVERLNEPNNPRWVSEAPPGEHYHVSIGPMTEIAKIPDWERKVKYLYKKFDDKNIWLYPTRVTKGWTLALDKTLDPIANDPIFQELHQTDIRWNIDEDNFGQALVPIRWVPNVPEAHVSM